MFRRLPWTLAFWWCTCRALDASGLRLDRRGAALGIASAVLPGTSRANGGLVIEDLQVGQGDGPPRPDAQVTIDYKAWLDGFDGRLFSEVRGPLVVPLGKDAIIPGLEQTILGMRVGGTRRVAIPPNLAYGSTGYPTSGDKVGSVIPPNSTLYFQIRLRSIKLSTGAFGLNLI